MNANEYLEGMQEEMQAKGKESPENANSETSTKSSGGCNPAAELKAAAGISMLRARAGRNAAQENKQAREGYTQVNPECECKIIVQPRVFGVRGTKGPSMAKSAIRLAIDTRVQDPSKFEKSERKNTQRTLKYTWRCTAKDAVAYLDNFEKVLGGKCSSSFSKVAKEYSDAKLKVASDLKINFDADNRPIISDEKIALAYFEALKDKSYSGFEVYVSVKPDSVRATRSKCFRASTLEEVQSYFSSVTFS